MNNHSNSSPDFCLIDTGYFQMPDAFAPVEFEKGMKDFQSLIRSAKALLDVMPLVDIHLAHDDFIFVNDFGQIRKARPGLQRLVDRLRGWYQRGNVLVSEVAENR